MKNNSLFFCIIMLVFLTACGQKDEQKIIGIWQNEFDWFDIKADKSYSTGTGPMTTFTNLKYTIDPSKKEITFYTNKDGQSYYMSYIFLHQDTLQLLNNLPNSKPALFYKIGKIPTGFQK
jgi:major membrane immunogen (membrane-anchored lipoprotein)